MALQTCRGCRDVERCTTFGACDASGRTLVDRPTPADLGFDDDRANWSTRRRGSTRDDGREARSIPHSYGGEGFNHVD